MKRQPYIAFEGPIASGKTSLATLLAKHLRAVSLLEDFQDNLFLPDFYSDEKRWALPMQLWFLAARHKQLKTLFELQDQCVVADYTFAKESIFARTLIRADREFALYQQIYDAMQITVRSPDLIVYLDATNSALLERIRMRNRAYEACIDQSYLNRIRNAYVEGLLSHDGLNLIRLDTSTLNIRSDETLLKLYQKILAALPASCRPAA